MENVSFSQSMMFRKSWDFMKKHFLEFRNCRTTFSYNGGALAQPRS